MKEPRLWKALLAALLPRRARPVVLDDLAEDFGRRGSVDPAAARRWYRREVLRGLLPALGMRFTARRRRRAPLPPLAAWRNRPPLRRATPLDSSLQDLRVATRNLRTRPAYLVLTTVTLAIGIAGSTIVFGVFDALMLDELPYRDADRLALVWERSLDDPELDRFPVTPANYLDWRAMATSFERLAAYDFNSPVFADERSAQRFRGLRVTGDLFSVLGVEAAIGRVIDDADIAAAADVVVLSDGAWRRVFGADPEVLGQDVVLDGTPTTVIGIMPPEFRFPYLEPIEVWRPLLLAPEDANDRSTARLFVVGRLTTGVSFAEARQEGDAIAIALAERYPESTGRRGINIITQRDEWMEGLSPMLQTFALAVGLGLAIAGLNLTGLMLSRGITRSGEIATRLALGASTGRVVRLLLAEAAMIALIGAGLGAVLAATALPWLSGILPPGMGGLLYSGVDIDGRALAFAATSALLIALLSGLVPSLQVRRAALTGSLNGAARATTGRAQMQLRRGLVVGQTTLALVLLGQAAVLGRSMVNAYAYDVGFNHHDVLTARVRPNADVDDAASFYRRLRDEAAALPGVSAATIANIAPLSGRGMPVAVSVDGSTPSNVIDAVGYNREIEMRIVGAEFFDLLEIPTVAGRTFGPADLAGSERVAVVNERFARLLFGVGDPGTVAGSASPTPDSDAPQPDVRRPLGQSLRAVRYFARTPEGFEAPRRIVGVVGAVAEWGVWMQPPIVYVPWSQEASTVPGTIILKTRVPPETLAEPLEDLVWRLGSRMPVENLSTLEGFLSDDLYPMIDFVFSMMGTFAGSALLLAAIGLYGVTAFQVRDRTREISIRIALGARAIDVLGAVLREGVLLASTGAILGAAVVALIGPRMAGSFVGRFAFDVSWVDGVSVGGAAAFLVVTAMIACVAPARRAARVDPAGALKSE